MGKPCCDYLFLDRIVNSKLIIWHKFWWIALKLSWKSWIIHVENQKINFGHSFVTTNPSSIKYDLQYSRQIILMYIYMKNYNG